MSELTIREMENGEEFADWFADLTQTEEEATGDPLVLEDHYLILSNAMGDWIGGLRYTLRGGVAHVQDIAVTGPRSGTRGTGTGCCMAFEDAAREAGAHLAEFWTDDVTGEAGVAGERLAAAWSPATDYIGGTTWYLMEKPLVPMV